MKNKWTLASDELPKKGEDVLMYISDCGERYIIGCIDPEDSETIISEADLIPIDCLLAWRHIPQGVEQVLNFKE